MGVRFGLALAAAGMLSGCEVFLDTFEPGATQFDTHFPTFDEMALVTYRTWAASYSDMPFEKGPISVVAAEPGGMGTYTFVPCRGGGSICGGTLMGEVGQISVDHDYVIISGLYDRTFWLSPGGDGALQYQGGGAVPLAWE